jgi:hypothetical protein
VRAGSTLIAEPHLKVGHPLVLRADANYCYLQRA